MTDWTQLSARASFASHRLIGWIYWDPGALERYAALGVEMGGITYIASRSAPLAPAGAQVVAAAFYSISPEFIAAALAVTAEKTSFEAIAAARDDAVVAGLRSFVPEICDGLASLASPLWAAADALPVSGRALFAAHRQAPRPSDPLLSAWLAVNCIREWRGDTHFAVLAAEDISGVQAGLLHNAYLNYPKDWIPRSRGADDNDVAEAYASLASRGLATAGAVNDAGLALRQRIEDRTDLLCERAWRLLGLELTTQFLSLVEPVGDRLLARIDETAGTEWMPAARLRRDRD
ncbi:MAG TPA: hypothetical protein VG899_05305 [Mycobacteriales bacterium]|nr:hypothetical protein [Mycobacteriales bacterium]